MTRHPDTLHKQTHGQAKTHQYISLSRLSACVATYAVKEDAEREALLPHDELQRCAELDVVHELVAEAGSKAAAAAAENASKQLGKKLPQRQSRATSAGARTEEGEKQAPCSRGETR
jgi:hypothetical protein